MSIRTSVFCSPTGRSPVLFVAVPLARSEPLDHVHEVIVASVPGGRGGATYGASELGGAAGALVVVVVSGGAVVVVTAFTGRFPSPDEYDASS